LWVKLSLDVAGDAGVRSRTPAGVVGIGAEPTIGSLSHHPVLGFVAATPPHPRREVQILRLQRI